MMPASKCQLSIRRVAQKWKRERRTGLPLGEGDVPARLVLDEFNLDLAPARLLVLRLVRVVVVLGSRILRVLVRDELGLRCVVFVAQFGSDVNTASK